MARNTTKIEATQEELNRACNKWLDTLGRKTDDRDEAYFFQNWKNVANCLRFVRAEIRNRAAA